MLSRINCCFGVLAFCFLTVITAQAEDTAKPAADGQTYGLKYTVVGQANLTQNTFSNWTPGGTDSLSWQANLQAGLTDSEEAYDWVTIGKFVFGQSKVGNLDYRKSADEIRLESVFTYNIPWVIKPYAAALVQTQFTQGYQYEGEERTAISGFFDPGYVTESLGASYISGKAFKTRLGFAVKEVFTREYPIPYTDDPDTPDIEKIKVEPGIESVSDLKLKLSDILLFTSQLNVFSNMKSIDAIVVRWENLLSAAVAKYVTVNFNLVLYYDKAQSTQRQLNQTLAVGLTYAIF